MPSEALKGALGGTRKSRTRSLTLSTEMHARFEEAEEPSSAAQKVKQT